MGRNDLKKFADQDTPAAVDVPDSYAGLLVWAVGRFGTSIVVGALCAWFLTRVYTDYHAQTDRLIGIFEKRAVVDADLVESLREVQGSVTALTTEVRTLNRK